MLERLKKSKDRTETKPTLWELYQEHAGKTVFTFEDGSKIWVEGILQDHGDTDYTMLDCIVIPIDGGIAEIIASLTNFALDLHKSTNSELRKDILHHIVQEQTKKFYSMKGIEYVEPIVGSNLK